MKLLNYRSYGSSVPSSYTAVALLPVSGDPVNSEVSAFGINSAAIVVGQAQVYSGSFVATRWTVMRPLNLGTFGGSNSSAFGINDFGAVCGMAEMPDGLQQAALWERGMIRNLGTIFGAAQSSVAYAIADGSNPAVFGQSSDASGMSRAVRWDNLVIQPLPFANDWVSSSARALGPNGCPAGTASKQSGQSVAVYWNPNPVVLSGLPGSSNAEVLAGQPSGLMVGQSNSGANTRYEAVFFIEGMGAISMQTIPGTIESSATGVNNYGVAVGAYSLQDPNGTIDGGFVFSRYNNVGMVDLSSRLSPGGPVSSIERAYAINDDGIITAMGRAADGQYIGVILLPN